jgi:hypothetical protein
MTGSLFSLVLSNECARIIDFFSPPRQRLRDLTKNCSDRKKCAEERNSAETQLSENKHMTRHAQGTVTIIQSIQHSAD